MRLAAETLSATFPSVEDGPARDENLEDEEAEIGGRSDGYAPLAMDAVRPFRCAAFAFFHLTLALLQNGSLAHGHKSGWRSTSAYRAILPFFLIVAAVLLLVIRLVSSSSSSPPPSVNCPESTEVFIINRGNTCWDLAQAWGTTVDDILHVNDGLNCDSLRPGQAICLPQRKT